MTSFLRKTSKTSKTYSDANKCFPADAKHEKSRAGPECPPTETQYSRCVPESGDCGDGLRDVTCEDHTHKIHCRIPCNWKKDISKTHTHLIY